MKQKKDISQEDLLALEERLTNKFQKAFQQALEDFFIRMDNRMDIKIEKLWFRMEDRTQEFRSDMLSKLDDVVGQLQDLREDRDIAINQTESLQKSANDHEKRITKLEKAQKTN